MTILSLVKLLSLYQIEYYSTYLVYQTDMEFIFEIYFIKVELRFIH